MHRNKNSNIYSKFIVAWKSKVGLKVIWWFPLRLRLFGSVKFHIDNKSLVEFFQLVLFHGFQSKPQRGFMTTLKTNIFISSADEEVISEIRPNFLTLSVFIWKLWLISYDEKKTESFNFMSYFHSLTYPSHIIIISATLSP